MYNEYTKNLISCKIKAVATSETGDQDVKW